MERYDITSYVNDVIAWERGKEGGVEGELHNTIGSAGYLSESLLRGCSNVTKPVTPVRRV